MLSDGDWWGYLVAAMIAVPFIVLIIEGLAALLPRRQGMMTGDRPTAAVLVPAHNEELHVAATVKQICAQIKPGDRCIVIADNCHDRTAEVARRAGAEALERHDTTRRGKGYALDFGLKSLAADPPGVVMVIDADTNLGLGAIDNLAMAVASSGRPVQGMNILDAPAGSGSGARMAAFAFYFKNAIRPRGMTRLGMPCLLYGTGMALPWAAVSRIDLAHGDITEDIRLGIELANAGFPAIYCPDAQVRGEFPTASIASSTQRQRWEHGHINTLTHQVPRLLVQGILRGRVSLIALALHLGVPPLALLVLVGMVAAAVLVLIGQIGPASLLAMALAATLLVILLDWAAFARDRIGLGDLLYLPIYVFRKIPLYLRYVFKPQKEWVRTERGNSANAQSEMPASTSDAGQAKK